MPHLRQRPRWSALGWGRLGGFAGASRPGGWLYRTGVRRITLVASRSASEDTARGDGTDFVFPRLVTRRSAMRTRRGFLIGACATIAAAAIPIGSRAHAQVGNGASRSKTRLILLGTGGGPRPRQSSMSTAQVIIANNVPYVVDCANGVPRQLVVAGVALAKVRHVFITHHHSDHNADYGNLLLLAWASGLRTRVDTWGPPPLEKITRLFFEMSAPDIDVRIADEGRVPLVPLIHPHELTQNGPVLQDDNVKVTAAIVEHPLVPSVDRLVGASPNATTLKKHIIDSHTPVEEVGQVAAAAGVKTLVLSHLVPAEDDRLTDQMWVDLASVHFKGRIIVAKD